MQANINDLIKRVSYNMSDAKPLTEKGKKDWHARCNIMNIFIKLPGLLIDDLLFQFSMLIENNVLIFMCDKYIYMLIITSTLAVLHDIVISHAMLLILAPDRNHAISYTLCHNDK